MPKPVVLDLCCGLGGWTRGFLAEGYEAVGVDIERHEYGQKRYPAELLLKDIRELCGYDLRAVNPALVVASPPCQRYSYMAMPWSRAKEQAAQIRADETGAQLAELNALFDACFRIARECGVPLVLENVKGAQPWAGRARAHFGSYYLWGDIESVGGRIVGARPQFGQTLRAATRHKFNPDGTKHGQGSWFAIADSKERGAQKREGRNFHAFENGLGSSPSFNGAEHETRGVATKNDGGSWFNQAHNTESVGNNPVNGIKQGGSGDAWFDGVLDERRREATAGTKAGGDWFGSYAEQKAAGTISPGRLYGKNSNSRKAASAMIAEIPLELARYVARCFKPA
jgi:site-specific DNA-cytosine methylase